MTLDIVLPVRTTNVILLNLLGILIVLKNLSVRKTGVHASTTGSLVTKAPAPTPPSFDDSGVSTQSLSAYGEGVSKYTGVTVAVIEVGGLTDAYIIVDVAAVGENSTDENLF